MIKTLLTLLLRTLRALAKMASILAGAGLLLIVILFKPLEPVWQSYLFDKEVAQADKDSSLSLAQQMELLERHFQTACKEMESSKRGSLVRGFILPDGIGKDAIDRFISKHEWHYEIEKKRALNGKKYIIVILN